MGRLDFKINATGGTLISFQYEYNDYLDEIGCIDPQTFKENQTKAKKQEPQSLTEVATGVDCGDLEENDGEVNEDPTKYQFENVLKSMIARLELYNSLAPIQEYGRHQTQATKKRKLKAEPQQHPHQLPLVQLNDEPNFNDQYYDLDDNFIDNDLEGGDDEMGADLHADHIYSQTSMTNDDGPKSAQSRARNERENDLIVKQFRVMSQ